MSNTDFGLYYLLVNTKQIPMLKILHLEDIPTDADLVAHELKKGKVKCEIVVVDNREDFEKALKSLSPDIILSDHTLPSFNSVDALAIVQKSYPQIPFILVTATASEDFAIHSMRAGAYDYILKDRLQRLPQSVLNAINKRRVEKQRIKYLNAVIASEASLKELNDSLEKKVMDRTAQLEKANKELESFGYSVSHDLKTPLTVIQSSAELLRFLLKDKVNEMEIKLLDKIKRNTLAMGQLVDDLLDLSRFSRSGNVEKEFIFMNDMVVQVAEELKTEFPDSDIKIKGVIPAMGNTGLIRQVWINLISNALKYSAAKEKPVIQISSQENESEIIYSVIDNGPGFDIPESSKLFDVFHRVHEHEGFTGLGIGLAIVKRIVENHGGRVWATAKPGEGASFFFSLPIS